MTRASNHRGQSAVHVGQHRRGVSHCLSCHEIGRCDQGRSVQVGGELQPEIGGQHRPVALPIEAAGEKLIPRSRAAHGGELGGKDEDLARNSLAQQEGQVGREVRRFGDPDAASNGRSCPRTGREESGFLAHRRQSGLRKCPENLHDRPGRDRKQDRIP
jgi:hypothetical protein